MHAQALREAENRLHPHVPLAALYPTNIVAMEAGAFGELFLADAERLPQPAHLAPKIYQVLIGSHTPNVALTLPNRYTRSV